MAEKEAPLVTVIDDEEDVLTFLRLALEDHGYRVTATTKPGEALALMKRDQPAVVLLDLVMPKQTGLSVYAEILEEPALSEVQVLFLSALNLGQEFEELLGRQVTLSPPAGFVEKPVDLQKLLETLETVLARRPEAGEGAP